MVVRRHECVIQHERMRVQRSHGIDQDRVQIRPQHMPCRPCSGIVEIRFVIDRARHQRGAFVMQQRQLRRSFRCRADGRADAERVKTAHCAEADSKTGADLP